MAGADRPGKGEVLDVVGEDHSCIKKFGLYHGKLFVCFLHGT